MSIMYNVLKGHVKNKMSTKLETRIIDPTQTGEAVELTVVEGASSRVEETEIDTYGGGKNEYTFWDKYSADGFAAKDIKHFAPKTVEIQALPEFIAKNAVKAADGQSLGILLGGGANVQRSVIYHGSGPSVTTNMGGQSNIDAPNRVTVNYYVPLSNITGMESMLQTKVVPRTEFEQKVETSPLA